MLEAICSREDVDGSDRNTSNECVGLSGSHVPPVPPHAENEVEVSFSIGKSVAIDGDDGGNLSDR